MAQYTCPDCGKALQPVTKQGIPMLNCTCGYQKNLKTGKEARLDTDNPCFLVACSHCGRTNRVYYRPSQKCVSADCPFCEQEFLIPAQKDPNLKVTVTCPHCNGKNAVKGNNGKLKVRCGHCGEPFLYNSGIWPTAAQQPTRSQPKAQPSAPPRPKAQTYTPPQPQPQPKPKAAPCRTLTVRRATHAYKEFDFHGLKNAVKDKLPVKVVLDDEELFNLAAEEARDIRMDSGEHMLRFGLLAPKYRIPAGTDNYAAIYFDGGCRIGPQEDPFRDQLTEVVLQMFRGPGIRQRITDSNNSGNKIYLDISPKGIRVYWRLKETKGFWQSLTGEKEEKLTYSQLGLTPPPEQQQPDGYWGFLQWWAEDAILADESIDMAYTAGGFVMGRQHGLL